MSRSACSPFLIMLALLSTSLASPAQSETASDRTQLADSSWVESWTLGNGLRVLTREIPGCNAVAVTMGYRVGSSQDPPGREGLATLLAELVFTAAAGEIPERTRTELESLRPLGWSIKVSSRVTLLSEVAAPDQAPGVLRQIATRMAGVSVSESCLATAIRTVRRDLGEHYFGAPDQALYYQLRDLATHGSEEITVRLASGRSLQGLTVKEAQDRLRQLYVPANAVLSLTGKLSGLNLHLLLEHEFGSIPPGTSAPEPASSPLTARDRVIPRDGLAAPIGAIGVIAPAITDSLHPSFYLNLLLIGSHLTNLWQQPGGPLPSRFQYSIFDEPELARLYPPVAPKELTTEALSTRLADALDMLGSMTVTAQAYDQLRVNVVWLLGGPMSSSVEQRVLSDTGALTLLGGSMATRALWGGDEFWKGYLARIEALPLGGINRWAPYFEAPEHQVRLLFAPRK